MKIGKETGRRARILLAAVVIGAALFGSGVSVGAATGEPGSIGDPLITESYLKQQLDGLQTGYACVSLAKGKRLELTQGTTVLLYTGSATVAGTLLDLTEGTLVTAGSSVSRYHVYLVPADGSGFTAAGACVVFVCGE